MNYWILINKTSIITSRNPIVAVNSEPSFLSFNVVYESFKLSNTCFAYIRQSPFFLKKEVFMILTELTFYNSICLC